MSRALLEAAQEFRAELGDFEPGRYSGPDCATLAEQLALTEKACATVRLLAAARAVECGAHKEAGVADPASWVARQAGTTRTEARGALELARSLGAHPQTKRALLSGAVSLAQAKEIVSFDDESPGHEHELLGRCGTWDLTRLREETRERRLAGTRPQDLHRRQMAARRFRHWKDGLGMVCFAGALPPASGVPFVQRIEREAQRLHKAARAQGSAEGFSAHAADALVTLCEGGRGAQRGGTDLVIVCDLYAFRRGHAHPGEPCHLVGGGPIPVEVAKELAKDDAFVKGVLHDGVAIHTVSHHGRHLRAELKTALDLGPVPSFSGRECVDCKRRQGLEYDHLDPLANHGPTAYANLVARCYLCHQQKTERDRKAGRLGRTARARPPGGPGAPTGAGQSGSAGPPAADPAGRDPP